MRPVPVLLWVSFTPSPLLGGWLLCRRGTMQTGLSILSGFIAQALNVFGVLCLYVCLSEELKPLSSVMSVWQDPWYAYFCRC